MTLQTPQGRAGPPRPRNTPSGSDSVAELHIAVATERNRCSNPKEEHLEQMNPGGGQDAPLPQRKLSFLLMAILAM